MKFKVLFTLVSMLLFVVLSGCGGPTPTSTLEVPKEATVSPTVVPTATSVPPTETPTPIPTPTPNMTELLESKGFKAYPDYSVAPGVKIADTFVVKDGVTYTNGANEFVLSYAFTIPEGTVLNDVQLEVKQPGSLIDWLVGLMSMANIQSQQTLPLPTMKGAFGTTLRTELLGLPVKSDVVIFQRGNTGAVVSVIYGDGLTPSISAIEVAQKFDESLATDD
jgi:hypothetical protein